MRNTLTRTPRVVAALGAASLVLSACGGVDNSAGGGGEAEWPPDQVQMYVGASPGGSSDLISRQVSKGLEEELGASFPVVNRAGANGALAAAEIKKSPNDGSVIANQNASLFTITPLAVSEDEAVSIDDFDVVGGVSRDDYVLVTNPKSGYKSVEDLKKATEPITYSTTGVGTGSQLSSVLFLNSLGVESTSVPFDGGAPALTALLGNQVDIATLQVGEAIENVEAGKVIPLVIMAPERVDFMPDVPTAKESGVDVTVSQYRFMTVPKGTSESVTKPLWEGMQSVFETQEYKDFNEANGLTAWEVSPEEVVKQLKADKKRYAELVDEYDIDLSKK